MSTLPIRFAKLLDHVTAEHPLDKWAFMERKTGIPRKSWPKAYEEHQRPTAEMIERVCAVWPQYTLWLILGRSDLISQSSVG